MVIMIVGLQNDVSWWRRASCPDLRSESLELCVSRSRQWVSEAPGKTRLLSSLLCLRKLPCVQKENKNGSKKVSELAETYWADTGPSVESCHQNPAATSGGLSHNWNVKSLLFHWRLFKIIRNTKCHCRQLKLAVSNSFISNGCLGILDFNCRYNITKTLYGASLIM